MLVLEVVSNSDIREILVSNEPTVNGSVDIWVAVELVLSIFSTVMCLGITTFGIVRIEILHKGIVKGSQAGVGDGI